MKNQKDKYRDNQKEEESCKEKYIMREFKKRQSLRKQQKKKKK
jgi:hypothetical protein